MFKNFTNPDNPLMVTMTHMTDCIFLSLFWFVGSFPLVGVSAAALYDSSYRGLRRGDKHSWGRFWHVYKTNWKAGIVPSLLLWAVGFAGAGGLIKLWNAAVYEQVSWAVFSGVVFVGIVALGVVSLLPAVLSRFENSLGGLLKNTALLALANLPRTVVLGMVSAGTIALSVRFIFPLFFLPALSAWLASWLIEPMFKPYMNEV